jgi:hypothetical protein
MTTYIKTTEDGRKVEVIGKAICLDGKPEAYELVDLAYHPNKKAILQAVPNATHMAGRLPLSAEQASAVRAALAEAHESPFVGNPTAVSEYLRISAMMKAKLDGIE